MKLNLRGHEDRYAIEQSLLAFFRRSARYMRARTGTATRRSHCMRAMYMPPGSRH